MNNRNMLFPTAAAIAITACLCQAAGVTPIDSDEHLPKAHLRVS